MIITRDRLSQATHKSDAVNRVMFLYICRALGRHSITGTKASPGAGPCYRDCKAQWAIQEKEGC